MLPCSLNGFNWVTSLRNCRLLLLISLLWRLRDKLPLSNKESRRTWGWQWRRYQRLPRASRISTSKERLINTASLWNEFRYIRQNESLPIAGEKTYQQCPGCHPVWSLMCGQGLVQLLIVVRSWKSGTSEVTCQVESTHPGKPIQLQSESWVKMGFCNSLSDLGY